MDVSVSINGKHFGNAIQSDDNRNLYVLPWNASEYDDGHLHRISVEIKVKCVRREEPCRWIIVLIG